MVVSHKGLARFISLLASIILAALTLLSAALPASAAPAIHRHVTKYRAAYVWAWSQVGCWYSWGGTGPCSYGYDCSGLVYRAYQAAGVPYFGRDTYQMLTSGRLHQVWRPKPGELAFFGDSHVELYAGNGYTYGALDSGTRVGLHKITAWWHPTKFEYVWGSS